MPAAMPPKTVAPSRLPLAAAMPMVMPTATEMPTRKPTSMLTMPTGCAARAISTEPRPDSPGNGGEAVRAMPSAPTMAESTTAQMSPSSPLGPMGRRIFWKKYTVSPGGKSPCTGIATCTGPCTSAPCTSKSQAPRYVKVSVPSGARGVGSDSSASDTELSVTVAFSGSWPAPMVMTMPSGLATTPPAAPTTATPVVVIGAATCSCTWSSA